MKKILYVGAEVMPFAATGGLGDVMGSLPASLAATGEVDVRVLKDILGHEQLNTTQIYTHLTSANLENAVDANPLSDVIISPKANKNQ